MRFAFALIALGLVAGLPATTRAQTWDEYRPAGIGFRIGPPAGPAIDGLLTSSIAAGRVTELHGGQACGE